MKMKVLSILVLILGLASFAFGQSSAGTIQGSVTDSQGAVVQNATVTITNEATGRAIALTAIPMVCSACPRLIPAPTALKSWKPTSKK